MKKKITKPFWQNLLTPITQDYFYPWQTYEGLLITRYKRFLADVHFFQENQAFSKEQTTVYCPNTGKMLGICTPGSTILLCPSPNKEAKNSYVWVATRQDPQWIGVHTNLVSQWALAFLKKNYPLLLFTKEPRLHEGSRFDFALKLEENFIVTPEGREPPYGDYAYIEVKNVHASFRPGVAAFPDTPTIRGQKHMKLLKFYQEKGAPCLILYMVQRNDCRDFEPADWIDPGYAQAYKEAKKSGVESAMLSCDITKEGVLVHNFIWL